jgi:hypothetical protein
VRGPRWLYAPEIGGQSPRRNWRSKITSSCRLAQWRSIKLRAMGATRNGIASQSNLLRGDRVECSDGVCKCHRPSVLLPGLGSGHERRVWLMIRHCGRGAAVVAAMIGARIDHCLAAVAPYLRDIGTAAQRSPCQGWVRPPPQELALTERAFCRWCGPKTVVPERARNRSRDQDRARYPSWLTG